MEGKTYNVIAQLPQDIRVVPTGMVPPVEIEVPNRVPYYYDPADEDLDSPGRVVHNLLLVPELKHIQEPITFPNVDEVLSYFTYRELTGYEEYENFYDGYPTCELEETIPDSNFTSLFPLQGTNSSIQDSIQESDSDAYETRLFAVASWHRVLHKNLDPVQLQPYLGFTPLKMDHQENFS